MSLIEQFPQIGASGGGGSWNGGTVTGQSTFDAEVDHNNAITFGSQAFALNGAAQTISATGGSVVRVTGSAASSTINLPASPTAYQVFFIDSQASAAYTLSGNGNNVDGAASKTVATAGPIILWFTGSVWESLAWSQYLLDARYVFLSGSQTISGAPAFSGNPVTNAGSTMTFSGSIRAGAQSASASSFTVVNTNQPYIECTYSPTGAQTVTLPSSPNTGEIHWIVDEGGSAATNNISVAGNGKNINGASTLTLAKNYAAVCLRYSGSNWFICSAYNYP